MITTGETTADALRPLLGITEKAIPSEVDAALPKIMSQVKVNHFAGSVGRFTPKNKTPAIIHEQEASKLIIQETKNKVAELVRKGIIELPKQERTSTSK